MSTTHTVVVVLEAKPGVEDALKTALISVIEPSRNENTCLEYRLHQDIDNPAQFVLYENWVSREAHLEQFQKPYILELGTNIEKLLAKPYQVIFSKEVLL